MPLKTIIILTPVYNDWLSFMQLICELDQYVGTFKDSRVHVIAINDGSTQPVSIVNRGSRKYKNIQEISVLHLARNLGHQRAIALGIAYVNSSLQCDSLIIMDADGEDQPNDIAKLLEASEAQPSHIIFAQRARRSEGWVFRAFYSLYKIAFKVLTGRQITFGNFSLIPGNLLNRVAHLPEIWNHFAAGIMRANIPWSTLPTQRGKRYSGESSMNFIALILHGLSAISVYIEILTVRLMLFAIFIIVIGVVSFAVLLYVKYFTPLAIPGWATSVAIGIIVIMFQAILLLAILTFLSLNYRSSKLFIPAKDYQDYLLNWEKFHVD